MALHRFLRVCVLSALLREVYLSFSRPSLINMAERFGCAPQIFESEKDNRGRSG